MPSGHPQNQKRRRRIRDTSEVSCCLKYVIFGFNVIFWVSGCNELKFYRLCNLAPWIGNPGHRDLGYSVSDSGPAHGSLSMIKVELIFVGVPARMASPSRFRSCQMV